MAAIISARTIPRCGQETIVGPRGRIERETLTCAHCNRVWASRGTDGTLDLGGHCRICDTSICGPCADLGVCDPFEKKLERIEATAKIRGAVDRQVARRQLFDALGI